MLPFRTNHLEGITCVSSEHHKCFSVVDLEIRLTFMSFESNCFYRSLCVSSDRKHWLDLKLCVACGRKCLHAVVRVFRLACSRSFVCLFWPQTRTPTISRWLFWMLCFLEIFLHQNILFLTKLFVTISNQSSWGYNLCVIWRSQVLFCSGSWNSVDLQSRMCIWTPLLPDHCFLDNPWMESCHAP